MKNLQLMHSSIQNNNGSPAEVSIVKDKDYIVKILASKIVMRYPSYTKDVKCYLEVIDNKEIPVIKGNNADIMLTSEEKVVIIGNNNNIYCMGKKDNILIKGTNNKVHYMTEHISTRVPAQVECKIIKMTDTIKKPEIKISSTFK